MFAIGYQKAVRNFKKRTKAQFEGYEICLDEVEDLGTFAEFEKGIDDNADSKVTFEEIEAFIVSLGLDIQEQVNDGYDIMLIKKGMNK